MEEYIKSVQPSPTSNFWNFTYFKTCSFMLYTTHIWHVVSLYYSWLYPCTHIVHYTNQNVQMSYCYCWLYPCRAIYSLLHGLENSWLENFNNHTVHVLEEDQLQPPLNLVTVSQELHIKQQNWVWLLHSAYSKVHDCIIDKLTTRWSQWHYYAIEKQSSHGRVLEH